uniref:Uncharacterized protein n=1 Tax=Neogobius melanostomus TaxID=47308 RepID=A0A8C6WZU3_9GOBI
MASVSPLNEDQLLCPICLEIFKDPISTSCGHNFCKDCIAKHWDNNGLSCPMCKKEFPSRPLLHVNTFISEICCQFKIPPALKENTHHQLKVTNKAVGVPCDICTGPKLNAVKSCPVCLFSYCQSHLEPHLTVPRLQKHQLTEPMENLEERICPEHDKPLELFCRTEQVCVCMVCTVLEHKSHDIVPLKDEFEKQQVVFEKTTSENRRMMEERRGKIREIGQSVELNRSCAQREMNNGVVFFSALLEAVQTGLTEFQDGMQKKHRLMEKKANSLVSQLETELCTLQHRDAKMERLSCSDDYLHIIQSFKSLKVAPKMTDWAPVSFDCPSFEGAVEMAVGKMELFFAEQKKLLTPQGELKRLQQHAVDITLDPDTASPWLSLSCDRKQVWDRGVMKALPYNPKRFSDFLCVLGKRGFSTGKSYYEVQVKGNANWDIGIVQESINKKDKHFLSSEKGSWAIMFRGRGYTASTSPRVDLCLKSAPQRVAVFLDYEQGFVSFYDAETAAHLHSFSGCTFTGKVYPFFSPGNSMNGIPSTSLIIKPVR